MTTHDQPYDSSSDYDENEFSSNHDCEQSLDSNNGNKLISFVVPVMNEEETIVELRDGIEANIPEGYDFELIFIDDGSTDNSWSVIQAMADVYPDQVRGLKFRANKGKASGLTAGFRAARGEIVFTMDADLQDDPNEIPRFLAKLDEGYDVVGGYKRVRHDPWHKVLPSRIFNFMLSKASKVHLHDHNCGFKCYRAHVIKQITLYGELHRMIPSLAGMKGYKVTEIVVTHHARQHGVSKYGIERFIRGFSDMLTIGFLKRFRERPSHFMNAVSTFYFTVAAGLGVASLCTGILTVYGLVLSLTGLTFSAMATGVFLLGLVSEQVIRGGNSTDWRLSIVEDTAADQWHLDKANPMLPVPVEYEGRPVEYAGKPVGKSRKQFELAESQNEHLLVQS